MNIFRENNNLFEAIYRLNEVSMNDLVGATLKRLAQQGEEITVQFLKAQFSIVGNRANTGSEGMIDDCPTNNRNVPQDPISKFVALTAIRAAKPLSPQIVLNFFKKYQKALNLQINFQKIEEFLKFN